MICMLHQLAWLPCVKIVVRSQCAYDAQMLATLFFLDKIVGKGLLLQKSTSTVMYLPPSPSRGRPHPPLPPSKLKLTEIRNVGV